jgi:hypothetical protein
MQTERNGIFHQLVLLKYFMNSNPLIPSFRFIWPFALGVLATLWIVKSFSPQAPNPAAQEETRSSPAQDIPVENTEPTPEPPTSNFANRVTSRAGQFTMQPDPTDDFSEPIPEEWETPLFAVLQQTNMALRNQGLLNMAINSAAHVPRVQAECLKHLTYGLSDKDPNQFLTIIRNPALPIRLRKEFLEESLRIRQRELAHWLASTLAYESQHEISTLARYYLNQGN